jgi:hypothetical protein
MKRNPALFESHANIQPLSQFNHWFTNFKRDANRLYLILSKRDPTDEQAMNRLLFKLIAAQYRVEDGLLPSSRVITL